MLGYRVLISAIFFITDYLDFIYLKLYINQVNPS